MSIDATATATTATGLIVVTGIPAAAWSATTPPADRVTITLSAPSGGALCATPGADNAWVRSMTSGSVTVEAPVAAGHFTYATFIACP